MGNYTNIFVLQKLTIIAFLSKVYSSWFPMFDNSDFIQWPRSLDRSSVASFCDLCVEFYSLEGSTWPVLTTIHLFYLFILAPKSQISSKYYLLLDCNQQVFIGLLTVASTLVSFKDLSNRFCLQNKKIKMFYKSLNRI